MRHLHSLGIVNFFVTGAVIYPEGGMYEEVCAVGFEVGKGKMVESVEGSSWDRKMPKDEVMRELFRQQNIREENVLVVGDGRTEIKAGVELGCVTVSRLPREAKRQRELQIGFGTNYIFVDYTDPVIGELIRE